MKFIRLLFIQSILCFFIAPAQSQTKPAYKKPGSAKSIPFYINGKTKIGRIIPDQTGTSRIYLIRVVQEKNDEGIIFTKLSFANPVQAPTYKIKIIFRFDTEIENAHCTVQGTHKNFFQKMENDKKGFTITTGILGKNSIIRLTIQNRIPVFATITGIRGKLLNYIMRTKDDDHNHDHH